MYLRWIWRGEKLHRSDKPSDFTSLLGLWREGWEFELL